MQEFIRVGVLNIPTPSPTRVKLDNQGFTAEALLMESFLLFAAALLTTTLLDFFGISSVPPLGLGDIIRVSYQAVNHTEVLFFMGTRENHGPQLYFFHAGGVLPITTVTIFRYVAKRAATQRNGIDEYSVEISGVSDLSFLFAMRFGAEV